MQNHPEKQVYQNKKPALRVEYETKIKQKVKKFNVQYSLNDRLKYFPKGSEKYIVRVSSHPPFDISAESIKLNIKLARHKRGTVGTRSIA